MTYQQSCNFHSILIEVKICKQTVKKKCCRAVEQTKDNSHSADVGRHLKTFLEYRPPIHVTSSWFELFHSESKNCNAKMTVVKVDLGGNSKLTVYHKVNAENDLREESWPSALTMDLSQRGETEYPHSISSCWERKPCDETLEQLLFFNCLSVTGKFAVVQGAFWRQWTVPCSL